MVIFEFFFDFVLLAFEKMPAETMADFVKKAPEFKNASGKICTPRQLYNYLKDLKKAYTGWKNNTWKSGMPVSEPEEFHPKHPIKAKACHIYYKFIGDVHIVQRAKQLITTSTEVVTTVSILFY